MDHLPRLSTFAKWPLNSSVNCLRLARASFKYTGVADYVKCTACRFVIGQLDSGNDPFAEHRRSSPHCPSFKEEVLEPFTFKDVALSLCIYVCMYIALLTHQKYVMQTEMAKLICLNRRCALGAVVSVPQDKPAQAEDEQAAVNPAEAVRPRREQSHPSVKRTKDEEACVKSNFDRPPNKVAPQRTKDEKACLKSCADRLVSELTPVDLLREGKCRRVQNEASYNAPPQRLQSNARRCQVYNISRTAGSPADEAKAENTIRSVVNLRSFFATNEHFRDGGLENNAARVVIQMGCSQELVDKALQRMTENGECSVSASDLLDYVLSLESGLESKPSNKMQSESKQSSSFKSSFGKSAELKHFAEGSSFAPSACDPQAAEDTSDTKRFSKERSDPSMLLVEDSDLKCRVCREKKVDTIFLPCRHLVCCNVCANEAQCCPACNVAFRDTRRCTT